MIIVFRLNSFSLTLSKGLKNEITSELCHFLDTITVKSSLLNLTTIKTQTKSYNPFYGKDRSWLAGLQLRSKIYVLQ